MVCVCSLANITENRMKEIGICKGWKKQNKTKKTNEKLLREKNNFSIKSYTKKLHDTVSEWQMNILETEI